MYTPDLILTSLSLRLACACHTFHYVKRLIETIFVHRFAHGTMPLRTIVRVRTWRGEPLIMCSLLLKCVASFSLSHDDCRGTDSSLRTISDTQCSLQSQSSVLRKGCYYYRSSIFRVYAGILKVNLIHFKTFFKTSSSLWVLTSYYVCVLETL